MGTIYVISAKNAEIEKLIAELKGRSYKVSKFDNLFEFKKGVKNDTPDAILLSDTLKEKQIPELLAGVKDTENITNIPIIAVITESGNGVDFMKYGAIDAISRPFDIEETIVRTTLRIQEMSLRQSFTSMEFFFSEAQEKEQGKRNGIFHFYNQQNTEVGNIGIQNGRVVSATFGNLIKEDAFLQLSCNEYLKFLFEDKSEIPNASINEGITGLLLEASKLKDEISTQEKEDLDEIKVLIIDENRIARIMASRVMKNLNYVCKVTSTKEMTVRFMANFAPQLLIVDYQDASTILDKLWPEKRKEKDIPVIVYCDEDINDINFDSLDGHSISGTIYKKLLHKDIKSVLQKINFI